MDFRSREEEIRCVLRKVVRRLDVGRIWGKEREGWVIPGERGRRYKSMASQRSAV